MRQLTLRSDYLHLRRVYSVSPPQLKTSPLHDEVTLHSHVRATHTPLHGQGETLVPMRLVPPYTRGTHSLTTPLTHHAHASHTPLSRHSHCALTPLIPLHEITR
jgi:hypothetical protein